MNENILNAASTIALESVASSFVAAHGWATVDVGDERVSIYVIELQSGLKYAYPNVPRSIWRAVRAAESIGRAYNAQIKHVGRFEAVAM